MRQIELPELSVPDVIDDKMPWHARASILVNDYGFQPTTISEINTAFSGVIAFHQMPAQTGRHLQEVLLRQKANPIVESPDKTVRAIVHSMGHFFIDAVDRREGLLNVYNTLHSDVNPNLDIAEEIDNLSALGVLSGIQHYAVRKGIANKQNASLQGGVKELNGEHRLVTRFDITDDENANAAAVEVLLRQLPPELHTTGGFKSLSFVAGRSQRTRRDFWREALVKSRTHLAARPTAGMLGHLGGDAPGARAEQRPGSRLAPLR